METGAADKIYHLVEEPHWKPVSEEKPYFPPTFKQDGGFTHATADPKALLTVGNHFYKDSKECWICLEIVVKNLKSNLKWEGAASVGNTKAHTKENVVFPHIYGPIHPSEVGKVYKVSRSKDGEFISIEGL
ncbi:hypothetical protein AAMO2058_000555100 [Amorphochlora amoebiformis]